MGMWREIPWRSPIRGVCRFLDPGHGPRFRCRIQVQEARRVGRSFLSPAVEIARMKGLVATDRNRAPLRIRTATNRAHSRGWQVLSRVGPTPTRCPANTDAPERASNMSTRKYPSSLRIRHSCACPQCQNRRFLGQGETEICDLPSASSTTSIVLPSRRSNSHS